MPTWAVEAPLDRALGRLASEAGRLQFIENEWLRVRSPVGRSVFNFSKAQSFVVTAAVLEDLFRELDTALTADLIASGVDCSVLAPATTGFLRPELWQRVSSPTVERLVIRARLIASVLGHQANPAPLPPDIGGIGIYDGHTISLDHFDAMWLALGLAGNWYPSLIHRQAITEVQSRRNEVAHWDIDPVRIGAGRTCNDLIQLISRVTETVEQVMLSLLEFLDNL
jgi:hypothetical protein